MGGWTSSLTSLFQQIGFRGETGRILILGLDGAGKTTYLQKHTRKNESVLSVQTTWYTVETISPWQGFTMEFTVLGLEKTRSDLWRLDHYFKATQGLIYIVDSNDRERFAESKSELFGVLENENIPRNVPVVIIANKQDLPNAASVEEVTRSLNLEQLESEWTVIPISAISGEGVFETTEIILRMVKVYREKKYTKLNRDDYLHEVVFR